MTKNWGSTRKLYVSAYLQCLFRTFSTYATHISILVFLHTAPLVCDLVEPCGTVSPSHRIIVCDRVTMWHVIHSCMQMPFSHCLAGTPPSGAHHADILACLGSMPTEAEWAERGLEKYGLIAVGESGEATQVGLPPPPPHRVGGVG